MKRKVVSAVTLTDATVSKSRGLVQRHVELVVTLDAPIAQLRES